MARELNLETAEMFIDAAINGTNGTNTQDNQLLKGIAILLLLKAKKGTQ